MTEHVVMFSGGVGSWMTAHRVQDAHPGEPLHLLFADTLMEDEDLYRFLDEAERDLGVQITRLSEGRNPWQVFHDTKYLGNTRIDPCSRILKRSLLRKYINENFSHKNTVIYLGIDWTESHRYESAKPYWEPWNIQAPLCERPFLYKRQMIAALADAGIQQPRLYTMGFPHNNCGGFCIKAGMAHFEHLLKNIPERYAYHEEQEQQLREYLGKDVSILRDRKGGVVKPLTLRDFRIRLGVGEANPEPQEWGGCGCFSPGEDGDDEQ